MTEYEMKIKEAANDIKYLRVKDGAMYSQMVFSLISIMLAKKKITKEDLNTIIEVERNAIKVSVKAYAESSYGQENSAITGTEDVKAVEKICIEYVDEVSKMIIEVAEQIAPPKKIRRKKNKDIKLSSVNINKKDKIGVVGTITKDEIPKPRLTKKKDMKPSEIREIIKKSDKKTKRRKK